MSFSADKKSAPAQTPAKILWVSCVGEIGGAEVYLLNFLRHLDRTRFRPQVFQLRPGPLSDRLRELDVPVHVHTAHRMRNVPAVAETILALGAHLRAEQIDLVHDNGFRAHVYGGLAAWPRGLPVVWTVHTAERPGLATSAIHRIPAAHVVANCARTADHFVARGHLTSLLWPGVDAARLAHGTPRAALATRFQLDPAARWICMAARMQRFKGQEYFLRALATLPLAHRDVQGVIIGGEMFGLETGYLAELKNLAQKLGLANRVRFPGFISDADVHGLLAASELVLHPALDEDFGLSVAEAQTLGRPVLAFASHGPSAIIADGQTGRLVPVGDQAALDRALADLLAQPALLRAWGETARIRTPARFGIAPLTRQLERIYATCLPARFRE